MVYSCERKCLSLSQTGLNLIRLDAISAEGVEVTSNTAGLVAERVKAGNGECLFL